MQKHFILGAFFVLVAGLQPLLGAENIELLADGKTHLVVEIGDLIEFTRFQIHEDGTRTEFPVTVNSWGRDSATWAGTNFNGWSGTGHHQSYAFMNWGDGRLRAQRRGIWSLRPDRGQECVAVEVKQDILIVHAQAYPDSANIEIDIEGHGGIPAATDKMNELYFHVYYGSSPSETPIYGPQAHKLVLKPGTWKMTVRNTSGISEGPIVSLNCEAWGGVSVKPMFAALGPGDSSTLTLHVPNVPEDLPDFAASSLDWDINFNNREELTFRYEVRPQGCPPKTTATLSWATGPSATHIIKEFFRYPIPAGSLGIGNVHVPADLTDNPPREAKYVLLQVDPDNLVAEGHESNNLQALPVLNDLDLALEVRLSEQTVKRLNLPGDTRVAELHITSLGTRPVHSNIGVQLFLSADESFDPNPDFEVLRLENQEIALKVGESKRLSLPFQLKSGPSWPLDRSGPRYVLAKISIPDDIDEKNNSAASQRFLMGYMGLTVTTHGFNPTPITSFGWDLFRNKWYDMAFEI